MKETSFHREIDQFITPEGVFNKRRFRNVITRGFAGIDSEESGCPGESKSAWLTGFLDHVLDQLHEKGLSDHAGDIISAALEISENNGISTVPLSTRHLRQIINGEEKRNQRFDKKVSIEGIYEAAIRIFAEKGFHGATMDEIAFSAGIGKGTIYRHFKSKEELVRQLLYEKYGGIMKRLLNIFESEGDVLLQIQQMIEVWINFIENNSVVYRLIRNESIAHIIGENTFFYDFFIAQVPMLKEKILVMNREKKLKTTDFYTVFYGTIGFVDGVVHKWFRRGMNYPLSNEIPVIVEVLFNGFVGKDVKDIRA